MMLRAQQLWYRFPQAHPEHLHARLVDAQHQVIAVQVVSPFPQGPYGPAASRQHRSTGLAQVLSRIQQCTVEPNDLSVFILLPVNVRSPLATPWWKWSRR